MTATAGGVLRFPGLKVGFPMYLMQVYMIANRGSAQEHRRFGELGIKE